MSLDMVRSFRYVLARHGKDNTFFLRTIKPSLSKYVVAICILGEVDGKLKFARYRYDPKVIGTSVLTDFDIDVGLAMDDAIQLAATSAFAYMENENLALDILNSLKRFV